ncbi:MAG: NAD(P)-dependent alcohol dehydrogenase [Desulfovibrionales bacterium]
MIEPRTLQEQGMMRAVFYRSCGNEDVLETGRFPEPPLNSGTIEVRVRAAGINPLDWKIRSGNLKPLLPRRLPRIPGSDLAGVVESLGPKVEGFKQGDRVFGSIDPSRTRYGSCAERASLGRNRLARLPDQLDFATGASLPIAGCTALQAIRDRLRVRPGQSLLVNGASGGVGHFAVQIARLIGAEVYGTCSPDNRDFVRDLGVDTVLDYTRGEHLGRTYDAVFDAAARLSWRQIRSILPTGRYVTTVPGPGHFLGMLLSPLQPRRIAFMLVRVNSRDLDTLAAWCTSGALQARVSRTFPLERTAEAHKVNREGHVPGKLVIEMDAHLSAP